MQRTSHTSSHDKKQLEPDRIFEYACHEGNYGMVNLLTGARTQEKASEEAGERR